MREKERETKRERKREWRERERVRERERERQRERQRETLSLTHTQRERQRERQRETEKERQRKTERKTIGSFHPNLQANWTLVVSQMQQLYWVLTTMHRMMSVKDIRLDRCDNPVAPRCAVNSTTRLATSEEAEA